MSEITKLYENAGLSNMWVERYNDGYYEHERYYNSYKEMINNMMKANDWTLTEAQEVAKRECRKEHPPFTAEKQISILNFCLKWGQVHILKGIDDEYRIENSCYRQGYQPTIADAIANYINEKWEKLTPEEKQQVKGILEE